MGIFEREVDPDFRLFGKPVDVEFARRDHHLALEPIDNIAIDIDTRESVIWAQSLNLLQLRFQRAPVPDPGVPERCRIFPQIWRREALGGYGKLSFVER